VAWLSLDPVYNWEDVGGRGAPESTGTTYDEESTTGAQYSDENGEKKNRLKYCPSNYLFVWFDIGKANGVETSQIRDNERLLR